MKRFQKKLQFTEKRYQCTTIKFSKTLQFFFFFFLQLSLLRIYIASPICYEILKLILNFVWMKIYCFPNHTAAKCFFIISRFFEIVFLICLLICGHTVFCVYKKYLFCIIENLHLYSSCRLYFIISLPSIWQLAWICGINRKKEM